MGKLLVGVAATALLMLAGCSTQKEPATQAANAAQTALAAVRDEATRYLPSDLKGVETSVKSLQEQLEKGDFESVLANAPALMTSINSLRDAVAGRKAVLAAATTEWNALNADVSKTISAIQGRLDLLSKSKQLPKELKRTAYDSAKSGFGPLKATWEAASSSAEAGDPLGAVAKAKEAQIKGNELLALLGMTG